MNNIQFINELECKAVIDSKHKVIIDNRISHTRENIKMLISNYEIINTTTPLDGDQVEYTVIFKWDDIHINADATVFIDLFIQIIDCMFIYDNDKFTYSTKIRNLDNEELFNIEIHHIPLDNFPEFADKIYDLIRNVPNHFNNNDYVTNSEFYLTKKGNITSMIVTNIHMTEVLIAILANLIELRHKVCYITTKYSISLNYYDNLLLDYLKYKNIKI